MEDGAESLKFSINVGTDVAFEAICPDFTINLVPVGGFEVSLCTIAPGFYLAVEILNESEIVL